MSADNWAYCPRCLKVAVKNQQELAKKANDSYGKIPAKEWLRMMDEVNTSIPISGPTLREDYEIRIGADSIFCVKYSCHCEKCGFHHEFKHEEQLELKEG